LNLQKFDADLNWCREKNFSCNFILLNK